MDAAALGASLCAKRVPAHIVLINGHELAELMVQKIQVKDTYVIKLIDRSFFDDA